MSFFASVKCLECLAKSLHSGHAQFPRSSLHCATSEISGQLSDLQELFLGWSPRVSPYEFAAQELAKNKKGIFMQVL